MFPVAITTMPLNFSMFYNVIDTNITVHFTVFLNSFIQAFIPPIKFIINCLPLYTDYSEDKLYNL